MKEDNILIVDPYNYFAVLKGLASEVRLRILEILSRGPKNVNEITDSLKLPQSTISTNIMILQEAGLIRTESVKGKKGTQKVCHPVYTEMVLRFHNDSKEVRAADTIEVEMPVGLYTHYNVSAPCGLCSTEGIIGYLDTPGSFLDPGRVKAGLLWFEKGIVEYKFPNNALYTDKPLTALEVSAELSSETPGTDTTWLSDITLWVNDVRIGSWTSPGDFGDRRGKLTPLWWKLEGSQYGLLKSWRVTDKGSFIDGVAISDVTLASLELLNHHSIKVKIGVEENAAHPGGINIFGRGFGNHNQDILLRLHF